MCTFKFFYVTVEGWYTCTLLHRCSADQKKWGVMSCSAVQFCTMHQIWMRRFAQATHTFSPCMTVCTMQYMHDGHKYVNVNKKWADNQDNCFTLRGSICNETIKGRDRDEYFGQGYYNSISTIFTFLCFLCIILPL